MSSNIPVRFRRSIVSFFAVLLVVLCGAGAAQAQGAVSALVLIDADTDAEIGQLTPGSTVNLAEIGTANLNVRADTTGAAVSVVFGYDGTPKFRTESTAPFAFAGDSNGDYAPFTFPLGEHTITATPFSQSNGKGTPGTPLTVTFTVTNDLLVLNPQSHNFSSLPLGTSAAVGAMVRNLSSSSSGAFKEQGGIVAFEIESQAAVPFWQEKTTIPGFTGTSYFEWLGTAEISNPGSGELTYKILISTPGNYELRIRSRIAFGSSAAEHNDSWIRFPSGQDVPGEAPLEQKWIKMYASQLNVWSWQTRTVDNDPHPIRQFLSAGVHELRISGRSKHHALDRVVLYHYESITFNQTTFNNLPQSPLSGGSSYTISEIALQGANTADFMLSAPATPFTLAGGEERSFAVKFKPQATGPRSAAVRVVSDAPTSPEILLLEGSGVPAGEQPLTVSPASHDFGAAAVGQTSPQPLLVTLFNQGAEPVSVVGTTFSGAHASDFETNAETPFVVEPNNQETVAVAFTPSQVGARHAFFTLHTSAGSYVLDLSGTGQTAAPGQQVVSLTLIDPVTDEDIRLLSEGTTINLATLPSGGLNVRANTSPEIVGSVRFLLSGTSSLKVTESAAPYALFGDANGNYNSGALAVGGYTLSATPYTQASAKGTAGTPLEISFNVVDDAGALEVSPESLAFMSAPVGELSPEVLKLSLTNTGAASITVSSLSLSGANASDFSVAADVPINIPGGSTVMLDCRFTPGAEGNRSAALSVISSAAGSPHSVSLTGTGAASGQPAITQLVLIDAETDQDLMLLENGAVLVLSELPAGLNVRADASPATVGSVRFDLNGAKFHVESTAPYAMFGDLTGDYNPGTFQPQSYTLKATPYSLAGGKGTAGVPLTISFEVKSVP